MAEPSGNTSSSKFASKDNIGDSGINAFIKTFTAALNEHGNKQMARIKEPDTYTGIRDALLIDGWIRSIERYGDFYEWDDKKKCVFATALLRDRADTWYRTLETMGDAPDTWVELKATLTEFFRPDNVTRIARDKLAVLRQTGSLVDYINQFMDIKLSIPTMTDEEASDKFIRGLSDRQMRAHIRQFDASTLKQAIHDALSFESANQEEYYYNNVQRVNKASQQVHDPMDIDVIEQRRYNNRNSNRRYNNKQQCYYCQKAGHIKRNCRQRLMDIRRLDEQHRNKQSVSSSVNTIEDQAINPSIINNNSLSTSTHNDNNKNLISFDPYSNDNGLDNNVFPALTPSTFNNNQISNTLTFKSHNVVTELLPIVYPNSLPQDLQHLSELNAIATTLPLYSVQFEGRPLQVLIDSGASENYVSPQVINHLKPDKLVPVQDRQVETAGGDVAQIKHKVNMQINLNGFQDQIMAYVFPTKFDLILGRSWLKQTQPLPEWSTDSWYLKKGSIKLSPCKSPSKHSQPSSPMYSLNYLISHKQAARYIKKGADSFLFYIKPMEEEGQGVVRNPGLEDEVYWDKLMQEFAEVFNEKLNGLPPERGIHHVINTGDAHPVSRAPYKMSPLELDELQKQLKELLELGLIRPSQSPWGAPVLFVRKKPVSGEENQPPKLRMCIDYRMLNKVTIKDTTPLPRIDECLERLSGARYFTSLDLRSGYFQVRIAPEDIEKTAFNTRYGKYEWLVLSMGLSNSPPAFMTLMNKILADYIDKTCLVYLDDILIYSKTLEEHKIHVRQVLEKLKEEKLIVNKKKCAFGKKELIFVGYKISSQGISADPAKIKVVQDWPRMQNVQDVRRFIGFTQFYKRLIKGYAQVVAPLTDLTRGTGVKKRPIIWTDECQKSFDKLKQLISSSPVLQVVNMDKPFAIEVDASDRACGAVLLQPGDDPNQQWHPISFESKKFSEQERKYPAQERELLGILHALRTWRCFVEGCPKGYKVYSDHLPLQYFRSKEKPPNRLIRYINELELYSPEILWKPGNKMQIADTLSRMDYDSPDIPPASESFEPEYLFAAWDTMPAVLRADWPIFLLPENRHHVKSKKVKQMLEKESKHFDIALNRIYRKVTINDRGDIKNVPFLRFQDRAETVSRYHESFGHAGFKTMMKMLTPRFWWPSMRFDVKQWLTSCPSCQLNSRKGRAHKDEMHPLKVPSAFDRWHLDFLDLPTTVKGNRWLLIGVDYATNWPVARAMPVASKEAVADFIYEEIVMNFGVPSEIVTDRGANFTSGLVTEYLKRVGVNHKLTSAYHPRTNGKAERFNGVIKQMLRKYTNGALHRWDDFVNAALFACRIRIHSTTGFSPFYLTYGREPKLPGDTLQPYIDSTTFNDPRTVADITSRELTDLGQHRAAAEFKLKAMAEKDKARWDKTIKKVNFEVGDMVMLTHEGRYGLEPTYKGPYIVVATYPHFGTYRLETLAGEPLKSLVHADRLKAAHGDRPDEPWYDPTSTRRIWSSDMNATVSMGDSVASNVIFGADREVIDPTVEHTSIPKDDNIDPVIPLAINDTVKELQDTMMDESAMLNIDTSSSETSNNEEIHDPVLSDNRVSIPKAVTESSELVLSPRLCSSASRVASPVPFVNIENNESRINEESKSARGRSQSYGGGDVRLQGPSANQVQESTAMDELMQDVPVELEIQLRKKQAKKRRFTPNMSVIRQNTKRKKFL